MKVAVVGATGVVGQTIIKVLEERNFPISELIPVARKHSKGKKLKFKNREFEICTIEEALELGCDLALFSAGGELSLEWAPEFAKRGVRVIDNSSAWRMNPENQLVVPEINGNELRDSDMIIANPNCSTIQMVLALKPLSDKYGLKRIVVSTYQSVSGTGKFAVAQMEQERKGEKADMVYPYPIDMNCLPHCDVFLENDYTKEEMKLVHESRKILNLPDLAVTATAVRVPVSGGHSESVNVELNTSFDISDVKRELANTPGITLQDNPDVNLYPMPLYAKGKDDVFVGRIRRDESQENTLNMWIVSDNLRKGAATNAVQIAEVLLEKGILKERVQN